VKSSDQVSVDKNAGQLPGTTTCGGGGPGKAGLK
jgi:hypothetical protein